MISKKVITVLILIIFCSNLVLTANLGSASTWGPYHTKAEKMAMWKALWDSNGLHYQTIGQSYLGNDILAFEAGNEHAPAVLMDGEMHGNEDYTSEILYVMATWLLDGSAQADAVLQKLHVIFIPIVDIDVSERGNADYQNSKYGVNLNRNFEVGWTKSSAKSDGYSGAHALSEPESLAVVNAFKQFKPVVYINFHQGEGPYAAYYSKSTKSYASMMVTEIKALATQQGIKPYTMKSMGSNGFAMGDAVSNGAQVAWLIETVNTWKHSSSQYNSITSTLEPKCRLFLIAASNVFG